MRFFFCVCICMLPIKILLRPLEIFSTLAVPRPTLPPRHAPPCPIPSHVAQVHLTLGPAGGGHDGALRHGVRLLHHASARAAPAVGRPRLPLQPPGNFKITLTSQLPTPESRG